MTINVSYEDIADGVACSPDRCPLALAISREGFDSVSIAGPFAFVNGNLIKLPFEARHFVYDFDLSEPVQPFEFELDV